MRRNIRSLQHFQVSLLVLFICFRREVAETRCIARERKALIQFKNGFVDDYGVISSWGRTSQNCCLWRGVGCSNTTNHVIKLVLHGYWSHNLHTSPIGFSGAINSSLLELRHLKYLDLSFNSFPRIPEFIGSLRKLKYLNLSNIGLEVSKVPPHLGNLSSLQTLDLSGSSIILKNTEWLYKLSSLGYLSLSNLDLIQSNNMLENVITRLPSLSTLQISYCSLPKTPANTLPQFTNFSNSLSVLDISYNELPYSSIYPWLFNFTRSLKNINLSGNKLMSTLPEAFGAFKHLQNLDLTNAGLQGGIPRSFGNLSNLRSLYLTDNNLKEDLPNFFHLLASAKKSIQVLNLGSNNISGSLPDFTKFTALRELHLGKNKLKESFPEKFEHISNLITLDLADNEISGQLPDLSALSSLRELYLERNRIEGTLAESIMPLSELQFLGVSSNLLHGTISEAHLANLSRLVYLDLSYNSLVLEFESDWSPTFSLDVILLSSCKLGPSFPTWLQTQKNFSILDISGAYINDSVPNWFWEQLTPGLRYLNLSSNKIHGTVPDLMYGDQTYIDLSSNNFSSAIPLFPFDTQILLLNNNMFRGSISSLWNLTTLTQLDVSNNQLSGKLPDFWMNYTSMLFLNLENNNFSGRIPTSMGSLSSVSMLSMRSNSLTGVLPLSLKNCKWMQLLDLGENNLSGPIPDWIGKNLTELRVLSLPSNGFHGTMPKSICSLSRIQIMDISVNNISGTIPRCLSNLKLMTDRRNASNNNFLFLKYINFRREHTTISHSEATFLFKAFLQWKGLESEYKKTLGLVISLDLSSNNFNGEIPDEVTNLTGLVALNLSRNNLSGKIPQDIGRLRWLDFLDLSRNHLVGGLPTSLSQVTNLGVLDLSNNNLSGRIPTSTQLQSFNISSYSGNSALCGLPLPNRCPGDLHPQNPQTTVETNDTGDEDKLVTRGFFICLSIGLAFGFWGFCSTLVFSNSWRYAYFGLLSHLKDWIYVMIAVNYIRMQRRS